LEYAFFAIFIIIAVCFQHPKVAKQLFRFVGFNEETTKAHVADRQNMYASGAAAIAAAISLLVFSKLHLPLLGVPLIMVGSYVIARILYGLIGPRRDGNASP
jgi:hypothetical protein